MTCSFRQLLHLVDTLIQLPWRSILVALLFYLFSDVFQMPGDIVAGLRTVVRTGFDAIKSECVPLEVSRELLRFSRMQS